MKSRNTGLHGVFDGQAPPSASPPPPISSRKSARAAPPARYTHGPNTDDPLILTTATASQYYHQDGLGSVVALSDTAGATVGSQRFDAWGNKLAATGAIPQYGYTGREPDETGLAAHRTNGTTSLARPDFYFKEKPLALLNQTDGAVNKTMMPLNSIQDKLELHPVLPSR